MICLEKSIESSSLIKNNDSPTKGRIKSNKIYSKCARIRLSITKNS
ncbi:hypothetical protein [Helicobacter labetoulli]|nr:hypothetical protein [Helicobacter labetoulli]